MRDGVEYVVPTLAVALIGAFLRLDVAPFARAAAGAFRGAFSIVVAGDASRGGCITAVACVVVVDVGGADGGLFLWMVVVIFGFIVFARGLVSMSLSDSVSDDFMLFLFRNNY
jgi:hypothetical protein